MSHEKKSDTKRSIVGLLIFQLQKDLCVTSPDLYMGHWHWCWFWPGLQLRWWPPRHHWQPGLLASSLYTPLACWIFCPLTFWALSQYSSVTTGNLPCCISRHKQNQKGPQCFLKLALQSHYSQIPPLAIQIPISHLILHLSTHFCCCPYCNLWEWKGMLICLHPSKLSACSKTI